MALGDYKIVKENASGGFDETSFPSHLWGLGSPDLYAAGPLQHLVEDANTALTTGFWVVDNNVVNTPDGWGYLIVLCDGENYIAQFFLSANGNLFTRLRNSAWGAWQKVFDQNSRATAEEIDAQTDNFKLITPANLAASKYLFSSIDLYIDKVNHRIGINRTDPSHTLSVEGGGIKSFIFRDSTIVRGEMTTYHDTSYYRPIFDFKRGHLTGSCVNGDALGDFVFNGNDGSNFMESAGIGAEIDTIVSSGLIRAAIIFRTRILSTGSIEERMRLSSDGYLGIGIINPTAILHLKAGTAAAGTAPLKLTSGVNLTTPEAGVFEFDGTYLYFTPVATRKTIAFTDTPPPDTSVTYAKLANEFKTAATVTSTINLSANAVGNITLSANTAFTFTNFQLGKFYRLIVTANGFTPSFAVAGRHVLVTGNETLGTSGIFYIGLECIDATSGSEKLLTTIMKGA